MNQKPIIALYVGGGGMRGIIPAMILHEIETKTGLPMSQMVDVFCGPSTGSILNAALNVSDPHDPQKAKYKAWHLVRFYEIEGPKIFAPDKYRGFRSMLHDLNNRTLKLESVSSVLKNGHYNNERLSYALKKLYGSTRLDQSLKSLVIPTYTINGDNVEDFTNYESRAHMRNPNVKDGGYAVWFKNLHDTNFDKSTLHKPPKVLLHDAVMASTAAPTYFPCHNFKAYDYEHKQDIDYHCIDGSIFDNPCMSYYGALRRHLPKGRPLIMITIGTGFAHRSIKDVEWNSLGSLGLVDPAHSLPLINIFFSANESALLESFTHEMQSNLHVLNKTFSSVEENLRPSGRIDDASEDNIQRMRNFSQEIISDNQKSFEDICELLYTAAEAKTHKKKRSFFRF